eukprot:m.282829 g.282829  ORF g.282829 m.282829 type:complete len:122 (+) comp15755_c0_seq62:1743-2108(+)
MFIAGMLDVSRRTYSETLADAHELCEQLGEKYELSDLCLQHSGSRGWHLILRNTKKSTEELPECFEQVHKHRGRISMTTSDLRQMNTRLTESSQEILVASNRFEKLENTQPAVGSQTNQAT